VTNSVARLAGLAVAVALVGGAAYAAASFGEGLRLAQGVERVPLQPPKSAAYVTSIDSEIFKAPSFSGGSTGLRLKLGDRIDAIADAEEGRWVLVARGGQGVGYVARAMLCPASLCKPGTGTASPPR
jgi:hypothetical protein